MEDEEEILDDDGLEYEDTIYDGESSARPQPKLPNKS